MALEKKVVIAREETSDQGTFGRLFSVNFNCFTGELPWLDNLPNRSCIIAATYTVVWTYSPTFHRHMYLILDTPGRSGCRFHSANLMGDDKKGFKKQLNGCVALGKYLGYMDGQKALLSSAPAILRFEEAMGRKPFKLEIVNGYSVAKSA